MDKKQLDIEKKKIDLATAMAYTASVLGITSAEITYAKAFQRYGEWFREKVEQRELRPSRIGKGETPTRWYSIVDIMALKSLEYEEASLNLTE